MKNLLPLELHTMSLNEGVMSEIHIMAKEARNVKEFIKEFLSEYGDKVKDSPETRKWLESMYNDTVNESIDEALISLPGFVLLAIGAALATRIGLMSDDKLQKGIDVTKATAKSIVRELPIIGNKIKKKEFDQSQADDIQKYLRDELSDQDIVDILMKNPDIKQSIINLSNGDGTYRYYYNTIKKLGGAQEYGRAHKKFKALRKKLADGEIEVKESVKESVNEGLNKSELTYQLSIDYSGNSKPKITKLNKKEIHVKYGYKISHEEVIKSINKIYPDIEFSHIGWSNNGSGGGVHKFKINESLELDISNAEGRELESISNSIQNFKLLSRNEQDQFLKNYTAILPSNVVDILKSYRVDENSGLNESERPRFKKRDRIEYRLTHQGGVGQYANAISKSDNVETGVIAKRTRTLAGFKYMLTTGLELSDHEILGLAESVTEKTSVKKGDYVLYKGNGTKWVKSEVMQVIPSAKKLHIEWNDEYIEVHVKEIKPVKESVSEKRHDHQLEYIVTDEDMKKSKFNFNQLKNNEFKIRIGGHGKEQRYMFYWKENGKDFDWESGQMKNTLKKALEKIAKEKVPIKESHVMTLESFIGEARAYKLKASEFGQDTMSAPYNVKGEKTWRVHSTYAIDQVSGNDNKEERDVVFFEVFPYSNNIVIKIGGIHNIGKTNASTYGSNFATTVEEFEKDPSGIAKQASDFLTDANHLKWLNKNAKSEGQKIKWALKDDYSPVIRDLVNKALGLKESVNEGKTYRLYMNSDPDEPNEIDYERYFGDGTKAEMIKNAKKLAKDGTNQYGDPIKITVTAEDDIDDVVWTNESVNETASPYELSAEAFTAELEKASFMSPNIEVVVGPSRWGKPGELRFRDHVTLRTVGNPMELYVIPLGGDNDYELYTDKSYRTGRELKRGDAKTIVKAMKRYVNQMNESVINEAEKYDLNFKIGDTVDLLDDTWEIIDNMKPNKKFKDPFTFQGEEMKQLPVYPPSTNKKAEGYKIVTVDGSPQYGFLYQYTGTNGKLYTKLAIVGVNESVNEGYHTFQGEMARDLKEKGVKLKKGDKVNLEIQPNNYVIYGPNRKQIVLDKRDFEGKIDQYVMYESVNEGRDDVVFVIDDGNLDNKFLMTRSLSRNLDYQHDSGDQYYVLPKRDFDRLEDYADSHGYDSESIYVIEESLVNEKKQLPKEISKHKDIPSWAKYVAQQSDGEWTWYEDTPTMTKWKGGGAWKQDGNQTYTGVKTDGKDWDKMPTYYYIKGGKITESVNEETHKTYAIEDSILQGIAEYLETTKGKLFKVINYDKRAARDLSELAKHLKPILDNWDEYGKVEEKLTQTFGDYLKDLDARLEDGHKAAMGDNGGEQLENRQTALHNLRLFGNYIKSLLKEYGKDKTKLTFMKESRNVMKLESFLNEELPTQEIDPDKFPDKWKKDKDFFKRGYKDDTAMDDVVETKPVQIPASRLKPSQDAVYLGKALGMAIGGVEGGSLHAIISSDNRILDGHHRWAATIFNNPNARVGGVQAALKIGDLIPVLRQAGDALGNKRGLPPKGGDINIFKATLADVRNCVYSGENMNPEFYNREGAIDWFETKGEKKIQASLNLLQKVGPPAGAPPREDMPKVEPEQVKNVTNKLAGGAIDVRKPYVGDPKTKSKMGGLSSYLNK